MGFLLVALVLIACGGDSVDCTPPPPQVNDAGEVTTDEVFLPEGCPLP